MILRHELRTTKHEEHSMATLHFSRRAALAVALAGIAIAAATVSFSAAVQQWLFERAAESLTATARGANEAGVGLLVFYHLLPAPDGFLMRRLFAAGVEAIRPGGWTIAEDGSL
jgi:hypothetical protein